MSHLILHLLCLRDGVCCVPVVVVPPAPALLPPPPLLAVEPHAPAAVATGGIAARGGARVSGRGVDAAQGLDLVVVGRARHGGGHDFALRNQYTACSKGQRRPRERRREAPGWPQEGFLHSVAGVEGKEGTVCLGLGLVTWAGAEEERGLLLSSLPVLSGALSL